MIVIAVVKRVAFHRLIKVFERRFEVSPASLDRPARCERNGIVGRQSQRLVDKVSCLRKVFHFHGILSRAQIAHGILGLAFHVTGILGGRLGILVVFAELLGQAQTCLVEIGIALECRATSSDDDLVSRIKSHIDLGLQQVGKGITGQFSRPTTEDSGRLRQPKRAQVKPGKGLRDLAVQLGAPLNAVCKSGSALDGWLARASISPPRRSSGARS